MITETYWIRRDLAPEVLEAAKIGSPFPGRGDHTIIARRFGWGRAFPDEAVLEIDGYSEQEMAERAEREAEYRAYCEEHNA